MSGFVMKTNANTGYLFLENDPFLKMYVFEVSARTCISKTS